MNSVNELKGKGKGRKALIVGGGLSVNEFDFEKIKNRDDIDIITINFSATHIPENIKIKYAFYNDGKVTEKMDILKLSEKAIVICTCHEYAKTGCLYKCEKAFFINIGFPIIADCANTGAKVVVISSLIFDYDETYLIGFDCKTQIKNGKEISHFYGEEYFDHDDIFQVHARDVKGRFIDEFESLRGRVKNVYNLNKESAIKAFEYKNI